MKDVKVVGVITYFPIQSAYIRGLKKYVDILEVRADYLQDKTQDAVEKFSKIKPIIFTARSEKEGGVYIPKRKDLYFSFLDKVDFIDVELSSLPEFKDVVATAKSKKKKVILSFHDFEGVPSEDVLQKKFEQCEMEGGDVFKVAVFATKTSAIVNLALFTRKLSFKKTSTLLCIMCMGDPKVSLLSRIVLPVFGSSFVYGRLGSEGSAPGQPDAFELYKILKA